MRLSIRPASVFNPLKLSRATHTARSRKPTNDSLSLLVRSTLPTTTSRISALSDSSTSTRPHAFYFFPFASFEFPGFSLNPARPPYVNSISHRRYVARVLPPSSSYPPPLIYRSSFGFSRPTSQGGGTARHLSSKEFREEKNGWTRLAVSSRQVLPGAVCQR